MMFRFDFRQLIPNDAELLTEDTIDTFGNMCLSPSIHSKICQKIIEYIINNAPNEVSISGKKISAR